MKPDEIQSFTDLSTYLRTFTTWDGGHIYDFGGALVLLGALLDNLRTQALDADLQLANSYLDPEQKNFLERLAKLAACPEEE